MTRGGFFNSPTVPAFPVMRRTAGLVVPRTTCGIPATVACGATCGIAGRVTRQATWAATALAPDRIACATTDQGLRAVTAETIR